MPAPMLPPAPLLSSTTQKSRQYMYPAIAGKPRAVIGGATLCVPTAQLIERAHDCACSRLQERTQGAAKPRRQPGSKLIYLQNSKQPLERSQTGGGFVLRDA